MGSACSCQWQQCMYHKRSIIFSTVFPVFVIGVIFTSLYFVQQKIDLNLHWMTMDVVLWLMFASWPIAVVIILVAMKMWMDGRTQVSN